MLFDCSLLCWKYVMFWRNALFFLWGFLRIQSWLMQLSFHLFDIYFAHSYYFGPLEDQNVWQLIRTDVWWSQAQYSTPPVLRGAVANWYANQDVKSPACSPLIPAQTTDLLALINRYVCVSEWRHHSIRFAQNTGDSPDYTQHGNEVMHIQ